MFLVQAMSSNNTGETRQKKKRKRKIPFAQPSCVISETTSSFTYGFHKGVCVLHSDWPQPADCEITIFGPNAADLTHQKPVVNTHAVLKAMTFISLHAWEVWGISLHKSQKHFNEKRSAMD